MRPYPQTSSNPPRQVAATTSVPALSVWVWEASPGHHWSGAGITTYEMDTKIIGCLHFIVVNATTCAPMFAVSPLTTTTETYAQCISSKFGGLVQARALHRRGAVDPSTKRLVCFVVTANASCHRAVCVQHAPPPVANPMYHSKCKRCCCSITVA